MEFSARPESEQEATVLAEKVHNDRRSSGVALQRFVRPILFFPVFCICRVFEESKWHFHVFDRIVLMEHVCADGIGIPSFTRSVGGISLPCPSSHDSPAE
jgi:hypothetical protein